MSSIIVNIGETGNGKGHRAKMITDSYPDKTAYVVDPARQFIQHKKIKQINPTSDIRLIIQDLKNSIVIVDEAQAFLALAAQNKEWEISLSQCRHNKTITIFNFHSLRQVPIFIRDYINIIIIGHSNDVIEAAQKFGKRTPLITNAILQLQRVRSLPNHLHDAITIY